jgi:hypothetical protein
VKLEELHLKVLLANEVDPGMRPESAPEQWVKIKSIKNKNSSSADKPTPKEGENILTAAEMKRCHWVKPSMVCHRVDAR